MRSGRFAIFTVWKTSSFLKEVFWKPILLSLFVRFYTLVVLLKFNTGLGSEYEVRKLKKDYLAMLATDVFGVGRRHTIWVARSAKWISNFKKIKIWNVLDGASGGTMCFSWKIRKMQRCYGFSTCFAKKALRPRASKKMRLGYPSSQGWRLAMKGNKESGGFLRSRRVNLRCIV